MPEKSVRQDGESYGEGGRAEREGETELGEINAFSLYASLFQVISLVVGVQQASLMTLMKSERWFQSRRYVYYGKYLTRLQSIWKGLDFALLNL